MAEKIFTTVQIDQETFGLLKELAQNDLRSTPKEIRFLVQAEIARRVALNVYAMRELPTPEGGISVPLMLIRKPGDDDAVPVEV